MASRNPDIDYERELDRNWLFRLGLVEERTDKNCDRIDALESFKDTAPQQFITRDEQTARTNRAWEIPVVIAVLVQTLVGLTTLIVLLAHHSH